MLPDERPLLIPCLALSAGIALGDRYGVSPPLWGVAALLGCLTLSCGVRHRLALNLCTLCFFLSWGMFALPRWSFPPPSPRAIQNLASAEPRTVEGIVRSRPVTRTTESGSGSSFILDVTGIIGNGRLLPGEGGLMVFVRGGEVTVSRGDLVRLSAPISVPRPLGLPGEFDFKRHLALQGVWAMASLATADGIVLMRGGVRDRLLAGIDRQALRLGELIRAQVPDGGSGAVLSALLIGEQKRIPRELADAYTRAGVSHILSISGFHVGIVAWFMAQTLFLMASRREWLALRFNLRRGVLLPALPAMLLYLLLTGAAPATARSVIMLAVFVLALYLERESDPINALLLSALLLLSLNPAILFNISFQLSFLSLWGMTVMVPAVMGLLPPLRRPWLRSLLRFTAASCAAAAATAVPLLLLFRQVSFNGILLNFLIVPLLGYGAVVAGFCALPLALLHEPLAQPLLLVAGKLVSLSNGLVVRCAGLPLLHFHGVTRLDLLAFLLFMCLATFVRPLRLKLSLCALTPLCAIAVHLAAPPAADGRLHVTMLSVGQAESLLLRLPQGSTLLVDGGGYLYDNGQDFGERILVPALSRLGVRRIDHMLLTHPHPDHLGGLPAVARAFPVGQFWEGESAGGGPLYDRLRAELAAQGTPRRRLAAGERLELPGGVRLQVLSPTGRPHQTPQQPGEADMNEGSLVFRLDHGTFSCLFTADAGVAAETEMLERGVLSPVTVLKVGHHGSRFSSGAPFLDRISPRIALISAGYGNRFRLPSSRTLEELRRRGVTIYRTDRDGSIELVSDGRNLEVLTPHRPP